MFDKDDKVYLNFEKIDLESERLEKKNRRKKKIVSILTSIILIGIGFLGGYFFYKELYPRNPLFNISSSKNNLTFQEIEALLEKEWLYKDEYEDFSQTLEDKAFYGMTAFDEDPYTTYMSQEELESFTSGINMNFVGIGVSYSLQEELAVIDRVFINSPAENAGLKKGDIIIEVDYKSIRGLTTQEIKEAVIGQEGTIVVISILRDNERIDFEIERGQVDNSVYCYQVDDYIVMELYSFGIDTVNECITYLDQFTDIKKIIIDLRDDGGGYQIALKQIAGLFIGNGKVYLQQAGRDNVMIKDYTSCPKTYDFEKIAILVDENTASAAEVLTICLKESLDNVTIVGNTTYGKGVIQSTHMLSNGGALKYSTYNWYSPNGVSINKVGITPDELVLQEDIYYEHYSKMEEDEYYEYDTVSEKTRLCQMCLEFLDYDIDRVDGYFNKKFENALNEFKKEYNLSNENILDKDTYDLIIQKTISSISKKYKDKQMAKAIEVIHR